MKKRAPSSVIRKRQSRSLNYLEKYETYARATLPRRRDKLPEPLHARTQFIRSSKRRTDPLFSPHSKTVLVRRQSPPLVPRQRDSRRAPILGRAHRTPGRRNPCTTRDIRTSVLFFKKLIGFPGSSPGRNRKYKRTVDSNYSCK